VARDRSEGGGFICVWRSFREDPVYFTNKKRRATSQDALLDLWLSASHKAEKVYSQGEMVEVRRGDVLTSILALSERWKWSRHRVERFLNVMEMDGKLIQKRTNRRTVLTICNYCKWQDQRPTNSSAEGHLRGSRGAPEGHVQQSEPSNHLTKSPLRYPTIDGEFDAFWTAWPKKVGKAAARKAWDRLNGNRPEIGHVLEAIRWQAHTDQWRREDGRFIPNPATWINQNRWLDEPTKVEKEVPWGPIIVND
jgi:hypothetical protein